MISTATIKAVVGCPSGKYSGGSGGVGTQVQTIIFPKSAGWTSDKAKAWLKSHDKKTGLDVTDDSFRARQKDPGSFDAKSFRTITLTGGGEAISRFNVQERNGQFGGRIPFKARVLAAVPGKSLNNRIYTRELLQQAAPLYEGKPFIMDHIIDDVDKVVGVFSRPRYATEMGMDGQAYEGLWLDGVGLMDEDLFDMVKGTGLVPPLVRGFSIGGMGEGDWQGAGDILLKTFIPAEGSLTAFPGIPLAHVATINSIEESLRRPSREVKKTSIPVREADVSLEEAEKQAAKEKAKVKQRIGEGQVPAADSAASVRSIRGLVPATNDSRPGLPTPMSRMPVVHTQPKATTSSDGKANIQNLDPEAPTAGGKYPREAAPGSASDAGAQGSKDAKAFKRKDPRLGQPTKHPGFGNLGPSGSGVASGEEEEEEEETLAGSKNIDNPHQGKTDKSKSKFQRKDAYVGTGATTHPGFGKQSPSGTGLTDQKDGEEEEESRLRHARTREQEEEEDNPMQDHPGKSCSDAHSGMSHDDFMDDKSEEEEEEHGPSPHIPGKPVGKVGGHAAGNAYDSPADNPANPGEEEEEETLRINQDDSATGSDPSKNPFEPKDEDDDDGVDTNPIRKVAGQGQNVGANPTRDAKGEEEEHKQVKAQPLFSDAQPISGKAFSLPTNAGILATLSQLASPQAAKEAMAKGSVEELVKSLTRQDHYVTAEQVGEMLMAWNKGKQPKEESPRKIVIHRTKPATGSSQDFSLPEMVRKRSQVGENVDIVRTRSITNIAPTMAASSVSTVPASRLEDLLKEEQRRPYSNVSYLNAAKRAWNRAVSELITIR